MRWDSEADPLVTGCTFLGNVRTGIYLGHEAKGTIRGNLLHDTHLSAIFCVQRSAPVIVGNTFVASRREAIYVSESASPVIRDNVFTENQVVIRRPTGGSPQGESDDLRIAGEPVIENNCLWENGTDYPNFPEDPHTVRSDPGFVDPDADDWRLAPDSPLRGRGSLAPDIGLADLEGLAAPLPVTPEEKRSMAVDGDKVDRSPPDPKATAVLEGRVVDQRGQPYAGFYLAFRWGEEMRPVTSARDGRFRVLWAPAGEFKADLWGGVKVSGRTKSDETLVLPDIVIPRPKTLFVEGTVTDGRGGAVANAYVRSIGFPPWSRPVATNEDGAFAIPVQGEGLGTVFTITRFLERSPLMVVHSRMGVKVGAADVYLFRGREEVEITVTDPKGRPIRDLYLALWGEAEGGGGVVLAHLGRSRWFSFTGWPARHDAPEKGPALTVPVPPGRYDLVAWRRGERWPPTAVAHRFGIVVKAPDTSKKKPPGPTRVELEIVAPGRIAGRVVTRDGKPVPFPRIRSAEARSRPGIFAVFRANAMGSLYATVGDEEGRFAIDPVAPGERWLRIEADGFAPRTAVVSVQSGKRAEVAIALDRKRGG
jgi:protocatechuate 3,4-dioxygenase beta subunit